MNPYFSEVKKNFGFGCMRLPMKLGKVDTKNLQKWWIPLLKAVLTTSIPPTDILTVKVKSHCGTALQAAIRERAIF